MCKALTAHKQTTSDKMIYEEQFQIAALLRYRHRSIHPFLYMQLHRKELHRCISISPKLSFTYYDHIIVVRVRRALDSKLTRLQEDYLLDRGVCYANGNKVGKLDSVDELDVVKLM